MKDLKVKVTELQMITQSRKVCCPKVRALGGKPWDPDA